MSEWGIVYLQMRSGGRVEFLIVGDFEKIQTWIENSFDRLFQELFEDSVLIDASLIETLVIGEGGGMGVKQIYFELLKSLPHFWLST